MKSRRHLWVVGFACVAVWSGVATAGEFGQCERLQYSFDPIHRNWSATLRLSTQGNSAGDALWDTLGLTAYGAASAGWVSTMVLGGPTMTITTAPMVTDGAGYSGIGDAEVIQRYSSFGAGGTTIGTTNSYTIWPDAVIQHSDMRILGPTVSDPACSAAGRGCMTVAFDSSCALGVATEAGTVLHELGHAYGFDHQDDVMSNMSSAQIDVLSCSLNSMFGIGVQRMIPDANGQMCMRHSYGARSGYDIGVSPVVSSPGCNARTSNCYQVPATSTGGVTSVTAGTTTDVDVQYTVFNNGDEVIGPVMVQAVLSTDLILDEDDIQVMVDVVSGTGTAGGFQLGDTQQHTSTLHIQPGHVAAMTIGPAHFVLLEVDYDGGLSSLSERDELNNFTDVRMSVFRTS